jgi:autotransporter-associated beta strand protein
VTVTGTSGSLNNTNTITLIVINTNQIILPTIANFGFETPSLGAGNSQYNASGAGWTFEGASPDGSGIMGNGSTFSNSNAPEGVQAAFLQEYGTISQAISNFIPGINYTITFAAAERGLGSTANSGGETWNVTIDNTVIGSYNPGAGATAYATYSASFTASAATHTLAFVGTDLASSNNTVFLDDVTIAVSSNQLAAPVVTLTTPANYAAFTAPATVNLAASVTTNGNVISSVQFYANSTLIGQVSSAPYTYAWSNVTNGNYDVYAQVVYNGGGVADSTAANILVTNTTLNLGFESPGLGAGNYQYNPTGASWTFTGSAAATNGSGIVANGSALGNPVAPEGVQAAFIRKYGVISQTLGGFTPGVNYRVIYSAAERAGNAQTWNVLLDNTVIQVNNAPGLTNYTTYAASFTASAAVHTLSFVGTDQTGGDNTVFLDHVSVSADKYDFGFETPDLGLGNFEYDPSGSAWTFSGASPNGSGIVANGSGFSNPNAPQGTQAAFVQEDGSISQAISGLIPGTTYTLSFVAAERPGNAQSWNVTMNGTTIGSYNPGSGATAYTGYTASFTATAATETLAFVGTDLAGGDNTIFIDNVKMTAVISGTPAAPASLTATAGNSQVSLSWAAVNGATSYNLAGSPLNGGPYTTLANITGTNYVNTGLVNGTTYYYVASAVNASGAGANSSQASATPQVPPPASLTAIAGNDQVSLSWAAVTGAVSYFVQSSTVNGGSYSTLANIGGTNYYDTGLSNGTTWYYVVSAMTAFGPTANSSQVSATPPGPTLTTISDFGFETPTNGGYAYDPSGAPWTFSGASPNGSGIVHNGGGFGNPNSPEGIQAGFVQEYGTITQTISGFISGTNYTISFLAAERPGYNESWKVTINGTTVGSFNPGSSASAYTLYKASFTATAASQTLAFVGTDLAGGDNTIFIDDVQIGVTGLTVSPSPQVTTNTLPVTASDVVGSQVTFTAGFMAGLPMVYQWQMITGGVTNNIPGATNTTLTLANLQLTNTASYQLQASNVFGVAVSSPSSLTVSSVPAAVNNVIASLAAQTGTGSGTFTPTWTMTTNNSLIAGQTPSSNSGNFSEEVPGRSVNSLTAGGNGGLTQINGTSGTTTSTNYVTCGNNYGAGSLVIYKLAGSVSGYDLTNITVYGGWKDAGRDQQAYTVYYSTIAAPTTFILLGIVNYLPANASGVQCATRATLTPATGVLASRAAAVEFNFTTPASENGYCGYAEINLSGAPSVQPVRWTVGNGNWDTTTLNWKLLSGGSAVSYVENNLAAFDDSATGTSPITVTLTGNHFPSVLTNNSTKNYVLAGNYALTGGNLLKGGSSTLTLDNGGANGFSNVLINNGTVQVGNNDTNGSLGTGNVTNNGALTFDRTDMVTVSNAISGSGTVVQNGSGTVALSAINTYTGNTTINAGTLALAGAGSIGASALIALNNGTTLDVSGRADQMLTLNSGQTLQGIGSVKGQLNALAGSTLSPGVPIGTMLVQGNITLGGTVVMALNRTNVPANDQLASVAGTITATGTLTVNNLGPALQPGDTFELFNQPVSGFGTVNLPSMGANGWVNNLANNGTIAVVSTVPPNVLTQVGSGMLTLAWPADHTGWLLQAQTNNSAQGLGTNWVDVTGSTTTNQMAVPMDGNNGSVFYRLLFQ